MFEVSIYNADKNSNSNNYYLVVHNTTDSTKTEFIASSKSQEELYQKAFETIDRLKKANLFFYIEQRQAALEEQETLSLQVGRTFRKLKDQDKATYYFKRANDFNRQRNELDQEVVSLISSSLSYLSSVPTLQ